MSSSAIISSTAISSPFSSITVLRLSPKRSIISTSSSTTTLSTSAELPYQTNKAKLVEKIAELVNEKKIEGISRLRDESDRKGMRVVIELKKDANTQVIINQLYKLSPLQQTFGILKLDTTGSFLIDAYPVSMEYQDFFIVFIIVFTIGFAASWYTSQQILKTIINLNCEYDLTILNQLCSYLPFYYLL